MYKRLTVLILGLAASLSFPAVDAHAQSQVVPCQLNNPDQDTLRLFPGRTNYRTEFIRTDETGEKRKVGGEALYRELEKRLGDKWDPIWETKDIPYVFYEILQGPERIGWVFGVNQGWPGADNSQLMHAFDLDERILEFYYQKLPSFEKDKLQTPQFYSQFIGLSLEQFYIHEQLIKLAVKDQDILALDMIAKIQDPTQKEHEGFQKTLRGLKKALIYVDDFKFANKIKKDEVFAKVKYLVDNKSKIPLLEQNALAQGKKGFPAASRYVVDLVWLKDKAAEISKRLGDSDSADTLYPVYVVYKDDPYKTPFVRGSVLGYVMPITIDKFTAVVAVGAQDKEKGKVLYVGINQTEFGQFKGLNLVNFYAKDVLTKAKANDPKIDKIAPIKNINVGGKDITAQALTGVKKALIITDEVYLHNLYKQEEIMKKIEEYLKK